MFWGYPSMIYSSLKKRSIYHTRSGHPGLHLRSGPRLLRARTSCYRMIPYYPLPEKMDVLGLSTRF